MILIQMISLECRDIDPLFLHSFLKFFNVTEEQMNVQPFRNIFRIGNNDLFNVITLSYYQFLNWKAENNKSLDDFLSRQVIFVKVHGGVADIKEKEIVRFPLFVAKHTKYPNKYLYGKFALKSKHPIKMPLEYILSFYNLEQMSELTFESCPPTLNLVKVSNNEAYTDGDCTGILSGSVTIGKSDNDYYWIPNDQIVRKRFYCTKLPGKCNVYFKQKAHLRDHLVICSDQTKIVSRQVSFKILRLKTFICLG